MQKPIRIGLNVGLNEPYWVMVRESIVQHAQELPIQLVEFEVNSAAEMPQYEADQLVEEIIGQKIDALVTSGISDVLLRRLLKASFPVILPGETSARHPRLLSLTGLQEAAGLILRFTAGRLHGHGNVLVVEGGGLADNSRDRRMKGAQTAARSFPGLHLYPVWAPYPPEDSVPHMEATFMELDCACDAILAASDYLALLARNIAKNTGLLTENTLVCGIGGDPLALDKIATGAMAATVDITPPRLCQRVLEVAYQAALGQPLPDEMKFDLTLVTDDNVSEVIRRKFMVFSGLPSRMVRLHQEEQQQRTNQLDSRMKMIHQISSTLDHHEIVARIYTVFRKRLGYDSAYVYLYSREKQALVLENIPEDAPVPEQIRQVSLWDGGLLGQVYVHGNMIFLIDAQNSLRYPPDAQHPGTRTRVILPIHQDADILGVLDLHSLHQMQSNTENLHLLQQLADQVGIALRNARIYERAVQAATRSEEADRLKTRLLANISNELRSPVDLILSASKLALTGRESDPEDERARVRNDLSRIQSSAAHLLRLINDLLDLSRAEIGELKLFPETIDPRPILQEVFDTMRSGQNWSHDVEWRLSLPEKLPFMRIDPTRFRQIMYNVLVNAAKFTRKGHVSLCAEVLLPDLHLWIEDTGPGIAPEQQERIFKPFSTSDSLPVRDEEGIGLGLAVAWRFVAMHEGSISFEPARGGGSIFHIRLPIPSLGGHSALAETTPQRTLLVVTETTEPPLAVLEIAARQGMQVRQLRPGDDIASILQDGQPAALAWDTDGAGLGDWSILDSLRQHPIVSRLPFLMFGEDPAKVTGRSTPGSGAGKPGAANSLLDVIDTLRPVSVSGPILIVDSDRHACEMYRRMAAKVLPQYQVDVVYSGHQAIERLMRTTPSLVVLELMMPGVAGVDVLEFLQSNRKTRELPVLVTSSRLITEEDLSLLNQPGISLQLKGILNDEEMAAAFVHALAHNRNFSPSTGLMVKKALIYLQQNFCRQITRQEMAQAIGAGETYLSDIFHQEFGLPLWEYLSRLRVRKACDYLANTNMPIHHIAEVVGLSDPAYLARVFRQRMGETPRQYRERMK